MIVKTSPWPKSIKMSIMTAMKTQLFLYISLFFTLTSCFSPESYKNKAEIIESMSTSIEKSNDDIEHLKASEITKEMILVDVRSEEETTVSMIKGAITQAQFLAEKDQYSGKKIVAYCTIGSRATKFAKKMNAQNIPVANLKGGVLAWAHHSGLFVKDGIEVKKVHVLSEAWNLLPDGFQGEVP